MNILNFGDKGNDVKLWQNFLILQGFDVKADGDFGRNTRAATRDFQAKHKLKADGAVGKNTLKVAVILGFAATIVEKPVAEPSPSASWSACRFRSAAATGIPKSRNAPDR